MKGELKKQKRLERQLELLKNFEGDFYQEKKIGNEWFIKMWNGGTNKWQVAVFKENSFKKYKSFQQEKELNIDMKRAMSKEEKEIKENWERPTLESIKNLTDK